MKTPLAFVRDRVLQALSQKTIGKARAFLRDIPGRLQEFEGTAADLAECRQKLRVAGAVAYNARGTGQALNSALGDLNEALARLDTMAELVDASKALLRSDCWYEHGAQRAHLQRTLDDLDEPQLHGGHGNVWARYRLALQLLREARASAATWRFELGTRVKRREDVFDPDSPYRHGTVEARTQQVHRTLGEYPEVYRVLWDDGSSKGAYLPHGLEPAEDEGGGREEFAKAKAPQWVYVPAGDEESEEP